MTHSRQVNAINSFHDGGRYHIETSPLICGAGFYMITASAMKELTRTNPHIILNDLHRKSMDWFLYVNSLRHERDKNINKVKVTTSSIKISRDSI